MATRTLVEAASKNDLELLEKALKGDVGNLSQQLLDDALLRAANNGNAACVWKLLLAGADVDCEDSDGDTPMMLAAGNGNNTIVTLLLNNGGTVNLTSNYGRTALHMAAYEGLVELVKILLEAGCDITIRDRYGDTALMLASQQGHVHIVEEFLRLKDPGLNLKGTEKDSALHYASKNGRLDCVCRLLSAKCDRNIQNAWGYTSLMLAATKNQYRIVNLITVKDCDVNLRCCAGKTALHYAVKNRSLECAKVLLGRGANPDILDNDDVSPLFLATESENKLMVLILLQANCSTRQKAKAFIGGSFVLVSPYNLAAAKRLETIMKLLILAGADFQEKVRVPGDQQISQPVEVPLSLKQVARVKLRTFLGWKNFRDRLHLLEIPKSLADYSAFKVIF